MDSGEESSVKDSRPDSGVESRSDFLWKIFYRGFWTGFWGRGGLSGIFCRRSSVEDFGMGSGEDSSLRI